MLSGDTLGLSVDSGAAVPREQHDKADSQSSDARVTMQENTIPDNEPSNPFRLNLNEIKSANDAVSVPSRPEPPAAPPVPEPVQPQPVEPPRPPEPSGPAEPPAPQPPLPFQQEPFAALPAQPPQPETPLGAGERTPDPVVSRETEMIDAGNPAQRWHAFVVTSSVLAALLCYVYWSTLADLLQTWKNNIDYHHGIFVAPFVAYFLWVRRDTFPVKQGRIDVAIGILLGVVLLLFWSVFRYYILVWSMITLDSWTIMIWVWAVCLICFGTRVFVWALPSLLFLAFMFPWPHSIEMQLREPLQKFAAQFSVYILRLVGEPAIAQANIVLMSDNQRLDIAAACSGIRVLVSVIAAAYAAMLLMRRPWWQNLLLFCLVMPVALFVNALRIAMTGLLIKHASAQVESLGFNRPMPVVCDEISGTIMLILTFILFVVLVWWFGMVFRRVEVSDRQTRILSRTE